MTSDRAKFFDRHTMLRDQWDELTPEQRAIATREVTALRQTHTKVAAWNVALNRARFHKAEQ